MPLAWSFREITVLEWEEIRDRVGYVEMEAAGQVWNLRH